MLRSFILPIVLATTIITGDSYAKSTVVNEVEGGNVYTRIEVEANGEKKVLESEEVGTHTVEVRKEGSSATVSAENNIATDTALSNATTTNIISNILKSIFDFIKSIFSRF